MNLKYDDGVGKWQLRVLQHFFYIYNMCHININTNG